MASEEGNNGNRQKYEESKKGNANKCSYDPLTSSETRQTGQGQEKRNWMKYCKTEEDKIPQCTKCKDSYFFFIDSTPFEAHLNTHSKDYIIKDTPEWVFDYFDIVPEKHYLKCNKCHHPCEVQFQGPFVDHFNEEHDHIDIGKSSQGSHRDTKITIESRTSKLIDYLFQKYLNRLKTDARIQKVQEDTKQKTWWRNCVNTDISDTHMRNTIICNLCIEPIHVSINSILYGFHMDSFHKRKKVEAGNTWLTKYFIFVHNTIICTLCNIPLHLYLIDEFGPHLIETHYTNSVNEPLIHEYEEKNYFLHNFLTTLLK